MTDLSDFKRVVYEPEVRALRAKAEAAEKALRRIASAGYVKTGVSGNEESATGDPRLEALADIAREALSAAAGGSA